ncbi:hypothetical protein IWW38_003727 [Coemansia aciculifera]|uniref:Uncharacterized protein n=1 Tax=Coemansia aciculifera TaxID=417176 RepID=A0ACC1M0Y0_9FUNG|nr:hypothetical protein IWW38_003727 [Coemansia aciculifera]
MSLSTKPSNSDTSDSSSGPPSIGHTLYSATTSLGGRAAGRSASNSHSSSSSDKDPEDASARQQRKVSNNSNSATSPTAYRADDYSEYPSQSWTPEELLEMRARERTFDGAYWRTSVGLFGAALVILRVFGMAFFPVGMVFLVLGVGFLAIGLARRRSLIARDTHARAPLFVTSGGTVLLSGAMCLSAYAVLLVLLWRL